MSIALSRPALERKPSSATVDRMGIKADAMEPITPLGMLAQQGVARQTIVTACVVISWYCSSIGLVLLNKGLLSTYDYRYPIFLTALHMICCTLFSYLAVLTGWVQQQKLHSQQQLLKIATIGVVFCFSLVGANTSLRYIPVSFLEMVGATAPFFTAVISVVMTRKYETPGVYMCLVPVVLGIVIASGFEPSFHLFGFFCIISAVTLRSFKSVLQGILLSDPSEKLNSLNLLLYMSPIAAAVLLPTALLLEDDPLGKAVAMSISDPRFMMLLLLNIFLSYFVNLANFMVTKYTGALSLQVLGNAKGVLGAAISVGVFKNHISAAGVFGYAITVTGVFAYSETKRRQAAIGMPLVVAHSKGHGEGNTDLEKQPLLDAAAELIKAGRNGRTP